MKERWACHTVEVPSDQSLWVSFKVYALHVIFKNAVSLCFVFRKQALCTLAAFSVWYWEIKDSLSLRKAIFLTMKHAKPKTSPSMYCLGCLQNQKHSTESTCLARASTRAAGGLRGRGRFASMGEKNSRIFFVVVIYVVGKWIDSERDGLWNTTGVVLCVYMCAYTTTERLRNVWPLLQRWVLQKVQNSPRGRRRPRQW